MKRPDNIPCATDSYKLGHWAQYPAGTEGVYSYMESRDGAWYLESVFFGLQPIICSLEGPVVSHTDVTEAEMLCAAHLPNGAASFNRERWDHVVREHQGRLPLRIKAVPEGMVIPTGNVMMTVENTCPACYWLTNAMESLLSHTWYPTTVCSRSRDLKGVLADRLMRTTGSLEGLPFMLHDFGYRSATCHEAAEIAGAAHLVNFLGTDTVPGMLFAMREYHAKLDAPLGLSVPATEHSVMTSLGRDGEHDQVARAMAAYPDGILSVVGDSYDIYRFVDTLGTEFKESIMARDGVFVVRPDSITARDPLPEGLVITLLEKLWDYFGGTTNERGFRVLDPHVRMIWGDGLNDHGIRKVVDRMMLGAWAISNIVFGMGSGLHQKLDRDTQRFAFKSSAQKRQGQWFDVFKQPLDSTKQSKSGRLKLIRNDDRELVTVNEGWAGDDLLEVVFENGRVHRFHTFEDIRKRAEIATPKVPVLG